MEKKGNNNAVLILLMAIIVILSVLCYLFATDKISLSIDNNNNQSGESTTKDNNIIDNSDTTINESNDNNYTVDSITIAKLDLFWENALHKIEVVDGKVVVDNNTYSITDEKIKYFYFNRYQCSHTTILYYLTEEGNVYVTEMSANDNNLKAESLNNFKKLNYSNVSDIVAILNDNYGKEFNDGSGITDNVERYLYALADGETYKLDYQYRC